MKHRAVSSLRLTGRVRVEVRDAVTDVVIKTLVGPNLVTTVGMNLIASFLSGAAPAGMTHFAIGTGSTAASAGDTALVTEVWRAEITRFESDPAALTVSYYLSSTALNGQTLREIGLFNASVLGTLYARHVLAASIAKTSSIAVAFGWELTWST